MSIFRKNNKNQNEDSEEVVVTDEEVVITDLTEDEDHYYKTVYEEVEIDDEDVDINELLDEEDRLEEVPTAEELNELLDEADRLPEPGVSEDGKIISLDFARKLKEGEADASPAEDSEHPESASDNGDLKVPRADEPEEGGEQADDSISVEGESTETVDAPSDEKTDADAEDNEDEPKEDTADAESAGESDDAEGDPAGNFVEKTAAEDKKKSRKKLEDAFVGAFAIIVIIGAAAAGLWFNGNRSKKPAETKKEVTPVPTKAAEEPETADYSAWENRDTAASAVVGDAATFVPGARLIYGSFGQNADGTNAPVAWTVLDVENGYALVVSEYILEVGAFSSEGVIQWENSDIRTWLNGDFYNTAFNDEEKSKIAAFEIENADNREHKTDGGHDTTDRLFLLSAEDIEDYFTELPLTASATPYVYEKGIAASSTDTDIYWTRTPGCMEGTGGEPGYVATVSNLGNLSLYGNDSTFENIGIRPAMWIALG